MLNFFRQFPDSDDPQRRDKKVNVIWTSVGLFIWFFLSSLCVVLHALNAAASQAQGARWASFLGVLSNSALLGAAFISIGALLGFIFGIPRVPRSAAPTAPQSQPAGAATGSASTATPPQNDRRLTPNTNLEDISDWLTKILVGAGLAQLAVLPGKLTRLAEFFHASMPLTAEAALMILLNFFVLGFMGSYLLTRLFLTEAFRTVEEGGGAKFGRVAQDLLLDISPGASKEERDAKYESYIYTCLYLDPPGGFERAIKACLEYLAAAGDSPNPRIMAYQAMAYGQKYDWDQKHGATKDALASLRNSTLAAVKRAVDAQPTLRSLLRTTWDPNDPTKLRGEENDLEVFFGDPDFKQILDSPTN
jgi:hypothetical protein